VAFLDETEALWGTKVRGIEVLGGPAFDVGLNAKPPEFSAVLAYHQIELLGNTIAGRGGVGPCLWGVPGRVPGIRFQRLPAAVETNYQYTPIVIDVGAFGRTRDEVGASSIAGTS
jgi:hypothetical protein